MKMNFKILTCLLSAGLLGAISASATEENICSPLPIKSGSFYESIGKNSAQIVVCSSVDSISPVEIYNYRREHFCMDDPKVDNGYYYPGSAEIIYSFLFITDTSDSNEISSCIEAVGKYSPIKPSEIIHLLGNPREGITPPQLPRFLGNFNYQPATTARYIYGDDYNAGILVINETPQSPDKFIGDFIFGSEGK